MAADAEADGGMSMEMDRIYAVISGDVVGSRRFADRGPALGDAVRVAYRQCLAAFDEALGGMPEVDIFAGDSWQMMTRSPALALRIGLCMRALLKAREDIPKADTRVAIGIGSVAFIDQQRLSQSQGEAFTLSGEALDRLRDRSVRMAVSLPDRWTAHAAEQLFDPQGTLDTMMALLEAICADWTARQSAIVSRALMGWTQVEIAQEMSISQPAVSQSLDAAKWAAVEGALRWWETAAQLL